MNNENMPLVSVVMATYNEPIQILNQAIESILQQSYKNFELLIMDDSTDKETINYLNNISENPKVKVVRKKKRMGLSGARNVGLHMAKGKYIAIMDADDISFPGRLQKQVNYMENNPECAVLGGQINIINSESLRVSERKYPRQGIKLYLFATYRNPIAHPTVCFRKELVDRGFEYDENLKMSEDLDLWLRIMIGGYHIENLPEKIVDYRVSDDFIGKRTSDIQKKYMADVRKRDISLKKPLFSIMSFCAGMIFENIPTERLVNFYNKENKTV